MATTHASATVFASALVDAEFSAHGLGGDVGLELFVDVAVFLDGTAAMWTGVGKRRLMCHGDGTVSRRRPVGVLTMLITAFAPRLLGLRLGQPFGERRGLTLAGTFLVVEAFLE